jgi:DNA (cytosine-5)-methyltransferase 1
VKVLDLFAGIGGFTIGLERAGFETAAFCEIDPYAQKVLRKNWPGVPIYDDVRTITAERLASDGIGVDIITGGFPCQDISVSGNQAGIQDGTRSGLWSECARLLGELRPKYAIFENVTNLLNGERGAWFKRVLWDISALGYDAEWHCIPASELGAHHHRDRIWIIAYPSGQHGRDNGQLATDQAERTQGATISPTVCKDVSDSNSIGFGERVQKADRTAGASQGSTEGSGILADTDCTQRERGCLSVGIRAQYANTVGASGWKAEPDVGRVANGIPARSHRLKCLGNAVVPPIPELIGRAINEANL